MQKPKLSYIICTSPRSGSTLLAEALTETGVAGDPKEWFNVHGIPENCKRWKMPAPATDYARYIDRMLEEGTTKNGIFGLKYLRQQFEETEGKLRTIPGYRDLPLAEIMEKIFPDVHYIWLKREDRTRQAISYYRASKSGVWRLRSKDRKTKSGPPAVIPFNAAEIARHERILERQEADWEAYFKTCGREPLIVSYKELAEQYEPTVRRVLEFIGVDNAQKIPIPPPPLQKQSDGLTDEWLERYLELKKNPGGAKISPPAARKRAKTNIPRVSCVICSSPRSGGWLLTGGLESVGLAGDPREWFNVEKKGANEENRSRRWKIPAPDIAGYQQYLARVLEEGATPNGVFSVKLMPAHFAKLPEKLKTIPGFRKLSLPQMIERAFPNPHYIWQIRKDKLRQAISYYRANQTDVWRVAQGDNAAAAKAPAIEYNQQKIAQWLRRMQHNEKAWEDYFQANDLTPLIVAYEDLAEHYEPTIRRVLNYLGVEEADTAAIPPPQYQKQADELTEEWVRRFHKELPGVQTGWDMPSPERAKTPVRKGAAKKPARKVSAEQHRWVAEQKLAQASDESIIARLKSEGVDADTAEEELRTLVKRPVFQAAETFAGLLRKRASFAEIQRALHNLNPKNKTVERRGRLTRQEFLEQYYSANRPVIFTGMMENWTAMEKWTPEYLKNLCGEAMVEISADRDADPSYETDATKHHRTVRFADYIDMVDKNGETNDYYLTARNEFFKNPGVEPMLNDIEIFPEYLDPKSRWMFLWYGPKGTVTPLHHDHMNIFMAQVKGRKRVTLVPAAEMDLVYNNNGVYSPIDVENPDYAKYPKFREANVMQVELNPGEVLFLPAGWWHHVRSLDMSITVTFMNFLFPNRFEWVHPKAAKEEKIGPVKAQIIIPPMEAEWLRWTKENLERNCDPKGIVEILLKNSFTLPVIRQAMGGSFPNDFQGSSDNGIDYRELCERPVARLTQDPGFVFVDNPRLQLYCLENFLSGGECDGLVDIIDKNLRPSTLTVYAEGFRTSSTCDLSFLKHELVEKIDRKIAEALGIRQPFSEGIQAQKYLVGQEFKPHTDYFEPGTDEYAKFGGERGNRTWTLMIYLNDTTRGGGTYFAALDKTFYPKKGMAVVWNNLYADGRVNPDTLHCGLPVEEGEKIIITKWFREKGKGEMFYPSARPEQKSTVAN